MKVGLIGKGAIARYVADALAARGHELSAVLVRPDRTARSLHVSTVEALPDDLDLMIECAGHEALRTYGPQILARGLSLITVSIGALANAGTEAALHDAARAGAAKLHLASGAIGALDCLAAARVGTLTAVTYTGRKPPLGWKGSPADTRFDLEDLTRGAHVHFEGSAREAAMAYPKNANVAAAVALAGLGFDDTKVRLIADAEVSQNVHEVTAEGDFGQLQFQISGNALPENPRSSALAAMSVLSKLDQLSARVAL
ncbi:MAG: aspartate dehydrogenase [Pseudomonadota bacterium]